MTSSTSKGNNFLLEIFVPHFIWGHPENPDKRECSILFPKKVALHLELALTPGKTLPVHESNDS